MKSRFLFGLGLLSATALIHPAFGAEDARTLQIVVSKDRQSLAVYDGDKVVATSKVSTGKRGHATPSGIFSILEKEVYHESNLYSDSPMPFMQRLTWSGIALHESNSVPNYPASHGCVRMPKAFAKMLYQMTERGVHVVIADQPLVPQPFEHAMLFQPEVAPAAALFSDLELRPTTATFLPQAQPVQVATNDVAALPDAASRTSSSRRSGSAWHPHHPPRSARKCSRLAGAVERHGLCDRHTGRHARTSDGAGYRGLQEGA